MEDEDAPPPLSSLPGQLAAVRVAAGTAPLAERAVEAAAEVTLGGLRVPVSSTAPKKITRGFFDAPQQPRGKRAAPRDTIPTLKGSAGLSTGRPQIPDFLRVKPDAAALKYEAARADLAAKLKPDEATLQTVMDNPDLMAGFSDPEVMRAVDEIARNPAAGVKYRDNKKVAAFYAVMGQVMGAKLDSIARSEGSGGKGRRSGEKKGGEPGGKTPGGKGGEPVRTNAGGKRQSGVGQGEMGQVGKAQACTQSGREGGAEDGTDGAAAQGAEGAGAKGLLAGGRQSRKTEPKKQEVIIRSTGVDGSLDGEIGDSELRLPGGRSQAGGSACAGITML